MKSLIWLMLAIGVTLIGCQKSWEDCHYDDDPMDVWKTYDRVDYQWFVNQYGDTMKLWVYPKDPTDGFIPNISGRTSDGPVCLSSRSYSLQGRLSYDCDYDISLHYWTEEDLETGEFISEIMWNLNCHKFTTWSDPNKYGRHAPDDKRSKNFKWFHKTLEIEGMVYTDVAEWLSIEGGPSSFNRILFNRTHGLIGFADRTWGCQQVWRRCPESPTSLPGSSTTTFE